MSIITTIAKYACVILVVACLTWQIQGLREVVRPAGKIVAVEIERKLGAMDITGKKASDIAEAVLNAQKLTGVHPDMLLAIMQSESSFNVNAVSKKGYKGLMQTPWAVMKNNKAAIHIDILHGAEIFREKLCIAREKLKNKGITEADILLEALAMYKGGAYMSAKNKNAEAFKEAKKTYKIYANLRYGGYRG